MKCELVLAHSSPDSPSMYRLNIPHTVQPTYTHTIYTVVKPSARVSCAGLYENLQPSPLEQR